MTRKGPRRGSRTLERLGQQEGAPVEALARAVGGEAWGLAVVAGADAAAAGRAATHAVVIGAVRGGEAAERLAILGLARSWALSSPGAGTAAVAAGGPVVDAFWALEEPLRAGLWCTDRLGLPEADVRRVAGAAAVAVARGRIRRAACQQRRSGAAGTSCAPVADLMGRVVTGHVPAWKSRMVREHAAGCAPCGDLLAALRDPTAAVAASLPPAPDLVAPAHRAWRDHVGAPQHPWAVAARRAAGAATTRRRPVVALLAVATAGTFGGATSQLAASTEQPDALTTLAAPATGSAAAPAARVPPAPVFRQVVIPALAGDVVADPSLAHVMSPDLAQVAPVVPLAPPPVPVPAPAIPQAAAPEPFLITEPPPAVEQQPTILDLAIPLPLPVPVGVEVEPCFAVSLGPIRIALPCNR